MVALTDIANITALTTELNTVNFTLSLLQNGGSIIAVVVEGGQGGAPYSCPVAAVPGVDTSPAYMVFNELLTSYKTSLANQLQALGITVA